MQVAQAHIVSPSGKKLAVNGKRLMERKFTYQVTVVNNSHWASISRLSYMVIGGTDLTIPVTWLSNSDSTCISASNATVTATSIVATAVSADMTITVSDAKYRVAAELSDTVAVSAVSPAYQFVLPNATATFTLTYNQDYSAADLVLDAGTVSGNTLIVPATSADMTAHLSTVSDYVVTVQNAAPYVSTASSFPTRPGRTVTIPVTYNDGSDDSCISVTGGTLNNSTITVANVMSDMTVSIVPTKVQVKASTDSPTVISAVSPAIQYVLPNSSATVTLTYESGYDQSNVKVSVGSVSGTTWTIPTSTSNYAIAAVIQEKVSGYTYFKLDVTRKISGSDSYFQLSEWKLYDSNGQQVSVAYVNGTAGNSSSEGPTKLFDNNTSTKWCLYGSSCFVICRTSNPVDLKSYSFTTGNDTATYKRNPRDWTISASAEPITTRDSSKWIVIDTHVNDNSVPVSNYASKTYTISTV